jgi:hypothetical protein
MWRKFCEIGNGSVECLWRFSKSTCGGTRNCSSEDLIFVFEASVTFKNSNKRNAHNSLGGIICIGCQKNITVGANSVNHDGNFQCSWVQRTQQQS